VQVLGRGTQTRHTYDKEKAANCCNKETIQIDLKGALSSWNQSIKEGGAFCLAEERGSAKDRKNKESSAGVKGTTAGYNQYVQSKGKKNSRQLRKRTGMSFSFQGELPALLGKGSGVERKRVRPKIGGTRRPEVENCQGKIGHGDSLGGNLG